MIRNKMAKIGAVAIGLSLAFGASTAGAQTIAELQAQINALLAQLSALQGGGTTTTVSACTFTRSLTVGSTGADVTCLQQALVSQGHLVMPAGVAYGYFGNLTRAAVAKWQAANGVAPAAGYFGPISQAKFASMGGTTGGTVGGTVGGGTITTPGVEGTITASEASSPANGVKVYEGGSRVAVLGIDIEADLSDVRIERVKLKLDAATSDNSDQQIYTKIANKIYVMDGSTVLASAVLDSGSVIKEGTDYYITVAGFSFVVPKDTEKTLTIAVDPKASWDSTYNNDSWTVTVPVDGVRGTDGAGINQYSPSTAFANSFTSAADVVDSAALTVSLASGSPLTSQVIANQGTSDDEYDGMTLAMYDFEAEDDDVTVTDFVVNFTRVNNATPSTSNVATATTAYIYDGSTLIDSVTVVATAATTMTATFADIDWVVPSDTTRTLTVKVDVDNAQLAADTLSASAGTITAENSAGSTVTASGSATGRTITIRKVGPEVSLVSKSITTNGVPQSSGSTTLSTSTLSATFNVKIKAVGGALTLGTVASGTPVMASTTSNSLTGGSFLVYKNGASDTTISSNATSTSYTIPSTCTSVGTNSCTLSDGNEVTIPVTFQIQGRDAASTVLTSGLYSVQFAGIQWFNATTGAVQTTNFMSSESDWRTADVSFP